MKLIIYTDHKNLLSNEKSSDRIMRWRLYLEEYGPDLRYIPGEANIVADALSRLQLLEDPKEEVFLSNNTEPEEFPMHTANIAKAQQKEMPNLQTKLDTNPKWSTKQIEGTEVITYDEKIATKNSRSCSLEIRLR